MKLDIIGSVASGKTTLAKELSAKYQVPFYEKDNIVWERTPSGDRKRSDAQRDKLFAEILAQEDWIVEGSPRKNLHESFQCCDYILLLDVNIFIRIYRVFRRWIRQRSGKESYNSKPTWNFLCWNIKWVFEYNVNRRALIQMLSAYGKRYKRFTTTKKAKEFLQRIYG